MYKNNKIEHETDILSRNFEFKFIIHRFLFYFLHFSIRFESKTFPTKFTFMINKYSNLKFP